MLSESCHACSIGCVFKLSHNGEEQETGKKKPLSQSQLGQEPISFIPLSKISITLKVGLNVSKVNADVDMKSNHYRRLKIDFCSGFDDLKKIDFIFHLN